MMMFLTKTQLGHKQLSFCGQSSQTTTVYDRYVLCHLAVVIKAHISCSGFPGQHQLGLVWRC
jgi:hypothetical protein